jgi:hypothetical protein
MCRGLTITEQSQATWQARGRKVGERGTSFQIRATSGLTTRWVEGTYTRNTWPKTRNRPSFLSLVFCSILYANADFSSTRHPEATLKNGLDPLIVDPPIKAQGVLGDGVPRHNREHAGNESRVSVPLLLVFDE